MGRVFCHGDGFFDCCLDSFGYSSSDGLKFVVSDDRYVGGILVEFFGEYFVEFLPVCFMEVVFWCGGKFWRFKF